MSKLLRETNDTDVDEVNRALETMGYNMGTRMVDEFFARQPPSSQAPCPNFKYMTDVVSKQALKMFLNMVAETRNVDKDGRVCDFIFKENPLAEYVVIPPVCRESTKLWYSNVYCGILRGALEMINITVKATFISDQLLGDNDTIIRVELVKNSR